MCGKRKGLDVHHKLPVHLFPEYKLRASNLVTLCRHNNCHLNFGHWGNYSEYNKHLDGLLEEVAYLRAEHERGKVQ